jgi:hypothetical protein
VNRAVSGEGLGKNDGNGNGKGDVRGIGGRDSLTHPCAHISFHGRDPLALMATIGKYSDVYAEERRRLYASEICDAT